MDYLKYSEESALINFLIDNKEPGSGMCMAAGLIELSEIQNKILNELLNHYCAEKNIEQSKVIDSI